MFLAEALSGPQVGQFSLCRTGSQATRRFPSTPPGARTAMGKLPCPRAKQPAHFQTVGRGSNTVSVKNQQAAPERGECFTRGFEGREGWKILRHFQSNRRLLPTTRASPAALTPAGTRALSLPGLPLLLGHLLLLLLTPAVLVLGLICKGQDRMSGSVHRWRRRT